MISELRDALADHGITRLYALDFEFQPICEGIPKPICVCYRCLLTGVSDKIWLWDGAPACPFAMNEQEAFVGYNFVAEASCFFALGWPRPIQVLDLFIEYLEIRNTWKSAIYAGDGKKERKRLLEALRYFGLETRDVAEKEYWQERALKGGPWLEGEPEGMMSYCLEDADDLGRLLDPLAQAAHFDTADNLAYAFINGRYTVAAASMVRTAVPVNGKLLNLARKHRVRIQNKLIERYDPAGVYEVGGLDEMTGVQREIHFSRGRMNMLIEATGLAPVWPRTDNGLMYAIDKKTLQKMAELAPDLKPFVKLRQFLAKIHPFDFDVGPDGRARTALFPFGTLTGRNNPSKYIFGADKGMRGFIQPGTGRALAYLDWERQELAVAGYLSGCEALLRLAKVSDPYIHLGITFGLIPESGTKDTHPDERARCKPIILGGVLYGMGPESIARKLEIPLSWGQAIWQRIRYDYRVYWRWAQGNADLAAARQPLRTPFGHTLSFGPHEIAAFRSGTARNFLTQATSAEIMRFAAIFSTEAGLDVCGPVHDAFLIEAPIDEIESAVAAMKGHMAHAVERVLGPDCSIAVDAVITRYPDSMRQKSEVFDIILAEIAEAEGWARANSARLPHGGNAWSAIIKS
jgi:hypothetical protein